ncbi:MAG: IclR family transcriptional regulator [Deltaproteobacteria bacterium]|nr:IclR family transcriptional regulator [Deltaproteobacteria bacterium]
MGVSSAEKVLTVLKAFSSNDREMGNLELSEKLGLPKSTANRLLHILESSEFVQQNPVTKRYMLGRAAADIGRAVNRYISSQLVRIAQPYLDRLRDAAGETVGLEMMSGKKTTLVYEAKGPNPVSVSFAVGDRLPLHVAAGGKAMLAFFPPERVDRIIKGKLTRYTPKTITRAITLKKQLQEIRSSGVAFDYQELDMDVHAIGAPVFSHEKNPVAGVVVAAPAFRMNVEFESKVIPLLKETAKNISARLFYSED